MVNYREESNSQYDFARFMKNAVISNYLQEGDYILMDNASIHHAEDSFEYIETLFRLAGVTIINTPTYSPELNPVELLFNMIKTHARNCEDPNSSMIKKVIKGIATITHHSIVSAYSHCFFRSQFSLILVSPFNISISDYDCHPY